MSNNKASSFLTRRLGTNITGACLLACGSILVISGCTDARALENAEAPTVGTDSNLKGVMTYHAAYEGYDTVEEVVNDANTIVKGKIVSSRVEKMYPEIPDSSDPMINPQAGLSQADIDSIEPLIMTVLTMEVDEVIDGDLASSKIEINQLGGVIDDVLYSGSDTVDLVADSTTEYVLMLSDHGSSPHGLLNPAESMYKLTGQDKIIPVDPSNTTQAKSITEIKKEVEEKAENQS